MPDAYLTVTATTTLVSNVHNAVGTDLRPLTGNQYTQRGAQNLDRIQEILDSDVGRSEKWAIECDYFSRLHRELQGLRNTLIEDTETLWGSLKHWSTARTFFLDADALYASIKKSSDLRASIDRREQAHHKILDKRERTANGYEIARGYRRAPQSKDDEAKEQQLEKRVVNLKALINGDNALIRKGELVAAIAQCECSAPASLFHPSNASDAIQDKLNECLQVPYVAPASYYQNGMSYFPRHQLSQIPFDPCDPLNT